MRGRLATVGATLALPLGNGVEWSVLQGAVKIGEAVVIQGPGQQGLAATVMARESGASLVIVSGRGTPTDKKRLVDLANEQMTRPPTCWAQAPRMLCNTRLARPLV